MNQAHYDNADVLLNLLDIGTGHVDAAEYADCKRCSGRLRRRACSCGVLYPWVHEFLSTSMHRPIPRVGDAA